MHQGTRFFMATIIKLLQGDITKLNFDAIVNAANTSLALGGGVCGAVFHAAGPGLYEECQQLKGCKTGEAKITKGYNLPARHIIHAVGPVWNGGNNNEQSLLGDAYQSSLQLAVQNKLKTIAFPNISTGIYGFPKQLAAEIACKKVNEFCLENHELEEVIFVCFDTENYKIYKSLINL